MSITSTDVIVIEVIYWGDIWVQVQSLLGPQQYFIEFHHKLKDMNVEKLQS